MKRNLICLVFMAVLPCWLSQALSQEKKDYTSKTPQYSFSETLDQQMEELKTNPLMLRFAASREELSSDRHRPYYHFTSPEGRLNDPNGLCYWQGNWHMFYQGYPPDDPRQHWGHAISKDLIHWKDLPYALYPKPESKCYSGSAWVEENRVIVMYQGVDAGEMVAISDDPLLLNWEKLTGGPVITPPKESEPQFPFKLWDPCIWNKDGVYYSLIGAWQDTGPGNKQMRADYLLRSENLVDWEYMHTFVEEDDFSLVGDDGACPYFWPIGDGKHILLHFSHMSGGKYLVGNYDTDRDKFVVSNGGHFNHGPVSPSGVHAPSAFPDGKGGVNCIFNMNPGAWVRNAKWNQLMTMPMNLTIDEDDYLFIRPTGDFESLRKDHEQIKEMDLPANREIVLDNIRGSAMEIKATIDTRESDYVELNVLRSPDKQEYTRIVFYPNRGYNRNYSPDRHSLPRKSAITLDNSNASILPGTFSRAPETADVLMGEDELAELHIFIDRSVVEVFVNGRQLVAARVYPGLDESVEVSIKARGSDAILKSLDAWQMDNIYD